MLDIKDVQTKTYPDKCNRNNTFITLGDLRERLRKVECSFGYCDNWQTHIEIEDNNTIVVYLNGQVKARIDIFPDRSGPGATETGNIEYEADSHYDNDKRFFISKEEGCGY